LLAPITGVGIATSFPTLGATPMFSQVSISEIVKIPEQKPDMEQLVSIVESIDILSTKVVNTGVGTSQEGQILTGKKLIVEVLVKQKVTYVADEPTQSVHAAHFEKPYSIFVVVPADLIATVDELFLQEKLVVKPYIEDICGIMVDKRTAFKCTALFLNVELCA
jgi:hypothetical protein